MVRTATSRRLFLHSTIRIRSEFYLDVMEDFYNDQWKKHPHLSNKIIDFYFRAPRGNFFLSAIVSEK